MVDVDRLCDQLFNCGSRIVVWALPTPAPEVASDLHGWLEGHWMQLCEEVA